MTDRTPRPHHPAILGAGHVSAAGTATPHVKQARTRTVTRSAQRTQSSMSPTTYTERSGHDTAHFRHLRHIRVSTHQATPKRHWPLQ